MKPTKRQLREINLLISYYGSLDREKHEELIYHGLINLISICKDRLKPQKEKT